MAIGACFRCEGGKGPVANLCFGGKGKLDPHRSFLIELIEQDGDMTMPELAGALADATGVQAHPDAIGRFH
ncbi:helix-turn-helix domain-containing protein [Roseovarius sp. MMSF_3281]|uniref:helix-turn-helix domain-containing protein n=1 Tax=Roseovarius sp. MMSF_3281 TaxID=3046694 RepID=UPI00273D8608|nr:helix-turn-helix domain-containing protein [Roseovarius sp. MMSF_3281]